MNEVKRQAIETMDELHQTIPYCSYCAVMDGLQEIETLRDRDEELEKLWAEFGDVPGDRMYRGPIHGVGGRYSPGGNMELV